MLAAHSHIYGTPLFQHTFKDGETWCYTDSGHLKNQKGTLLFIHGLANFAGCWQPNIQPLKDHYRCIAFDLPGCGLSAMPKKKIELVSLADSIHEFITTHNLQEVSLVGHSMGGQIALHVAHRHPQSVQKLLLISTAGFEVFSFWDKQFILHGMNMMQWMVSPEEYLKQMVFGSFYEHRNLGQQVVNHLLELMKHHSSIEYQQTMKNYIQVMLNEPVFSFLKKITQPTLVIFGEHDTLIPNPIIHPGTSRQIGIYGVKEMPNAELHMIKKAGHFVQLEQLKEVNQLLVEFALQDAPMPKAI